jgi:MerR family transcriptional regulator, mercuric resistance operon regulatory protein
MMSRGQIEMKVGQLAEATGVSVQAIRFYERRGLLPAPRRLQSGYRDYPAGAVRAVLRIKRMQEVGFTLRELEHFLRLLDAEPHNHVERRAYAEAKIRDIDAQIERLRAMREELSSRLLTCECCNPPAPN